MTTSSMRLPPPEVSKLSSYDATTCKTRGRDASGCNSRCAGAPTGAASLHRNRPAAYLGSLADTFPTLAALPRLAPLLNAPHTWHTSPCAALRDAAAAWDYIAGLRDAGDAP